MLDSKYYYEKAKTTYNTCLFVEILKTIWFVVLAYTIIYVLLKWNYVNDISGYKSLFDAVLGDAAVLIIVFIFAICPGMIFNISYLLFAISVGNFDKIRKFGLSIVFNFASMLYVVFFEYVLLLKLSVKIYDTVSLLLLLGMLLNTLDIIYVFLCKKRTKNLYEKINEFLKQ